MNAYSQSPIISPRLQIPPARMQTVARTRLVNALNQGLHRKLTLVSAPAGYGKSTLLAQWAAGSECALGWVTLSPEDNDPERFLAYLIAAIQSADADLSLENLLGSNFSLQPVPLEARLPVLINQLSTKPERLVVVLDDYHLVEGAEIHAFMEGFLDNLPPTVHLVISTRMDPPLRLARLRARDQLNEITEKDLRFNLQEAEIFFDGVMGLKLTGEQAAELEARTEGWVTGLQLVSLSLKDRPVPDELIETLNGSHRYILDYLVEEVFADLPKPLQEFLLRVSILERLSPDLCEAVVGNLTSDQGKPMRAREVLEFMDAANLFLLPLDTQRQWYRFHSLFAEFLQDRLAHKEDSHRKELHHRAASWFAIHKLPQEAVRHSLVAGDLELAAQLIQDQSKILLGRGEVVTLMCWINQLPQDVVGSHPQLGMARAWSLLLTDPFMFREIQDQLTEEIGRGFGVSPGDLLEVLSEARAVSEGRDGLGEFAMLVAYAQRDTRTVTETIRLFEAAFEHLPESDLLLRGFTLAGLASTYVRAGSIQQAEETFANASRISQEAGSVYGYVACTDWQAMMQAEQGQLRRAADTYRQAIDLLSSQGKGPLPLSGHGFTGLASVQLEWNQLDSALENVEIGLRIGRQVGDIDALLNGCVILARVFLALDRLQEAHTAIREAGSLALETKNTGCIQEAEAHKALLALHSGDIEAAWRWGNARGLGESDLSSQQSLAEIESLTYSQLLAAAGRAEKALPVLKELLTSQEQAGRMRASLETMTLLTVCLRALGRTDEAVRVLARALLLAEPEGYVRVFIDHGPAMAALLRTAASQGHSPAYARSLLELLGEATGMPDAPIEALSERELEVLRLAAEGLTNQEIASALVIAQSTVKTHINHIYSKLGVKSRTQAVVLARQLQILP